MERVFGDILNVTVACYDSYQLETELMLLITE